MSCHAYQDLLRDVNQAFPKEAMETFIEMQCGISGPFGTGGSMFAGANHFDQQISSLKMDSLSSTTDLIPTSLPGINLPPELQLIFLTLDKVALASCFSNPEEQNANLAEKMEPVQLPQSSKRVRMPLCGFDSNPLNATIPMDISMDFCHGWWGSDSNENDNNTADSNSTSKSKGSVGEHVESHGPSKSRSRSNIPSKSSAVKRPRKPSAKKCDTIMDDEDSGNEASEDANIPSITIVIDADQEDSDDNDNNAKGKRPNTHKKRQVPRAREEIPSSSTSKSGKGSRKRKYYSPRSGNFRNQASPRSSPRTARNSKDSKRGTGYGRH